MKNFKFLLSGLAFIGLAGNVLAQSEEDALRFSRLDFGGTARVQAMGGANQAMGADLSSLSGNPAGLGLYRSSDFNITPALTFNESQSRVNNFQVTDNRNNFNFSSFGVAFTDRKDDAEMGDWRSGTFGIGFTRLNNFQNRVSYQNEIQDTLSIIYYFADEAFFNERSVSSLDNEVGYNDIYSLEGLAWATGLLDVDSTQSFFEVPALSNRLQQREDITTRGAQNQWDFAYGASFRDKLYIGGSLGVLSTRYIRERSYREADTDADTDFNSLTLRDELKTTGTGVNLRFGLIYRPTDYFRVGASIQSPTWGRYTDKFETSLASNYTSIGTYSAATTPNEYTYNIHTPYRANGGIAVFAGKYGFLTADIEYVNYASARMNVANSDDLPIPTPQEKDAFRQINTNVRDLYQGAVNIKVGAEGRYEIFRFRLGYAHYGNPYRNTDYDWVKSYRTAGIGVRQKRIYVDLAFVNSTVNSLYTPFMPTFGGETIVDTKNTYNGILASFGVNF